jgi:glyoxylase-like metal-dependent hydrolase (beta-lactamase superfamily II)
MTSSLPSHIFTTGVELMPGVPLHVYGVKGPAYSVLIDTGIVQMKQAILHLCEQLQKPRLVLITHAHADHTGCNHTVKQATGALIAASGALPWIENYDIHYQEFCLPEITLEYTPNQKDDVYGIVDEAVHVDLLIDDGNVFRLGDDIELHTIAVPGHKLEEVAFWEPSSKSLFMGDVLLALKAPFFHGFQTSRGFYASLEKIHRMIEQGQVEWVYAAHHPPLDAKAALHCIQETRDFLAQFADQTLAAADGRSLTDVWKTVCTKMNRPLEFRGYASLKVQLSELETAGMVHHDRGHWWAR